MAGDARSKTPDAMREKGLAKSMARHNASRQQHAAQIAIVYQDSIVVVSHEKNLHSTRDATIAAW